MYAACEVNESDREFSYKHMRHTEEINKVTYQRPLALETLDRATPVFIMADNPTVREL